MIGWFMGVLLAEMKDLRWDSEMKKIFLRIFSNRGNLIKEKLNT